MTSAGPLTAMPWVAATFSPVYVWTVLAIIVVISVAMIVVAYRLRRRYQQDVDNAGGDVFSLGDLRRLHREGQLTDEEFERAKAQIIAAYTSTPTGDEDEDRDDQR